MTPAELLARLRALGAELSAAEGRLRVNAPRGQLTDELKEAIAAHKPELLAALAIPRLPRGGPLPLSFFQARVWVLHRLEPESTVENLVAVFPGAGDVARAVDAARAVIARHEILHAVVRDEDAGLSAQVVPGERVPIQVEDLSALSAAAQDDAVRRAVSLAAHVPFELASQPPLRVTVFRLGVERVAFLVAAHHIAVDAWSLRLLGAELTAAAAGEPVGAPPPLQYADYAAWERRARDPAALAAELAWWKQHLAGSPPVSTLPPDPTPGLAARGAGACHTFRFSRELSDGIRALARQEGATGYMALVAACAAVLRWTSGQDDLVLGCPMGVRERPELETMIGPFVNLLALRVDLSGDPSVAQLLGRARTAVLDAHAHRQVSFEQLVEHLRPVRSTEHAPLLQVAVVQHSALEDGGAPITGGGAAFDLTWFSREVDGRLENSLEYRADRYRPETIARLARRLEAFLAAAVDDRGRRLSEVPLLAEDERRQVLETFNATARATDPAIFPAQLERQAALTPDACAVRFEGAELSYRELDRRANQLARRLEALGVGPGAIAAIGLARSLDMLVAAIAVQKAGGAYLPLDPEFPPDRLSFMLADSGARVVIAGGKLPAGLVVPEGVPVLDVDAARAQVAALPDEGVPGRADPASLAYVLYTSGSTGRPKGVRVSHGALASFLAAMREAPGLGPSDTLAAVTTLSFDIAGLELYLPLVVGARIELVGKATAASGPALAALLAASGATVMQATPATWRLLVEAGWRGPPAFRALCGGETLPRDLADALLARAGELWNLYGPTETTIWSTAGRVQAGAGPVSIGRPIANTRVYILDGAGHLLPPGVPGEIWIGGAGVAEGYHGRPELTAERFRPDPFVAAPGARMYRTGDLGRWDAAGNLEHLGRGDHQVKVRGFRIELGEIEAVLTAHPAIKHAVVVARRATAADDVRLVAYVVFAEGEDLTVSEVRRHARTQLPDYMVPPIVVTVDQMPRTPNGKLDRDALPDPYARAPGGSLEHVPPGPGAEQALAEIWKDVLKVERVGAEDNFFELGGHSLLSLRVAAAVEKRLGKRLDPRVLFFQNLRQVAALLAASER